MLTTFFLDLLFPPRCVRCFRFLPRKEEKHTSICSSCYGEIKLQQTLFCGKCRARLPEGKKICHHSFPFVLGAATLYHESKSAEALIKNLKFHRLREAAEPLASLMADYCSRTRVNFSSYFLLPLPLSRPRERERGFNQSELIARALSKKVNLPLLPPLLIRTLHTPPQSIQRGLVERQRNIAGCFAVSDPQAIKGKNILLVDDVVTSGSTLAEAASTLKGAGAERITALVAASA